MDWKIHDPPALPSQIQKVTFKEQVFPLPLPNENIDVITTRTSGERLCIGKYWKRHYGAHAHITSVSGIITMAARSLVSLLQYFLCVQNSEFANDI